MKAIAIPFHMRYGSIICSKRLQSDRPKCRGHLVEAGTTQKYGLKIAICLKKFKNFKSADSPDIPLSDEV